MKEQTKKIIGVYCSSSSQIDPQYFKVAQDLGIAMAQKGFSCCNGGGDKGLMCAISDAILQHNGTVIGVIPQFMIDMQLHHKNLTKIHIVRSEEHTCLLQSHSQI